ncbi:MAG TPA: penicillin-binding protein 2 [Pseudohaliea sp.]|nr:penicillin-binding protein 2 [Pseudohaliea sp.]
MDRETERYRSLTRRALVLGGLQTGLFGALAGRMYYLQVVERERYRVLAEENRINIRLSVPSRGRIVDRFGVPLAVNNQNFRVVLVAEEAGDVEETLDHLSRIVTLTDFERRRALRDIGRRRAFVPVTLVENLDWRQVSRLEANAPRLPGVSIEVGELRHYPHGPATAHILGHVGAVSESELTGDPVLALPGFRIGKTGVERQLEENLRGQAGASQVEVNALGRVIRELHRDEGTPGADVRLTIDIGLQEYVQDRLRAERSAAAVVLDVETGEVFAMASQPSFDPNQFTTGISLDAWNGLINDPHGPLNNKAITGQYAPGSTFKMLVALAALEEGIIGPGYQAWCPGFLELGNHRFHCWRRGGHGWMALGEAISQSCDVYFYELSRRIGIEKIAAMANRFGLGGPTGIDLPGEKEGLMPTRAWKQAMLGQPWQPGETLIAAIGQGYVLATPLQLAVMTARIANGRGQVRPRVTLRVGETGASSTDVPPAALGVSETSLALIRDGMVRVTSSPTGTARWAQIDVAGMEMAGKTGTSQVRRISTAERISGIVGNEDRPWRLRDHALFVAYAPIHAPRYAAAVVVEHGGSGSRTAAPIARDILLDCQQRNPARQLVADAGSEAAGARPSAAGGGSP